EPIILPDIDRDAPEMRHVLVREDIRAFFAYPMRQEGRVTGFITLSSLTPRTPSAQEVAACQLLAELATSALENARLFVQEQRQTARMTLVAEVGRLAVSTLDMQSLLRETAEAIHTAFGYHDVLIALVDRQADEFVGMGWAGPYADELPETQRKKIDPQKGIIDWVARVGETLVANDVSQEPRYRALFPETRSELCVPIKAKGETIGILNLESDQLDAFSADDVATFEALADRLAVAIENARLFQETQGTKDYLQTLIASSPDAIVTTDTRGCITFFSSGATTMFGYPPEEVVGQPAADYFAGGVEEARRVAKRLAREEQVMSYETIILARDGRRVEVSLSIGLLRGPGAQPIGGVAVLKDISEQKRLREESEQRLVELTALFEVSSALRGAATVDQMLPIILDKTLDVVGAQTGLLALLEAGPEVVVGAARGPEVARPGARFPLEMLPAVCPVHTAMVCTESHDCPLFGPARGQICFPLQTGEAVVGLMAVEPRTAEALGPNETRLLTAIADMAGNAIHRASLFEQLQARVRELTTVYEVGKAVTAILHIKDVLGLVAEVAPRALHAEGCYLFLWEERQERLVLRAVEGYPPELVGEMRYRLGEGLAGRVFLEGKMANVPDLAADPRWKREPEYEAALPSGLANNALVVPLVVGTKTLGVLGVVNKIGALAPSTEFTVSEVELLRAGFTESDESLLTALAGQVAVALENARLYGDVRDLSVATIRSLATAIDARDPYTKGHSDQVARLSVLLAWELGWQGADLEMLEFAALLHDVGKIGIPDAVLKKTEPLTLEEWNNIHLHPYHSAQMVKPVEPLQRIIPWIYHHQERWDGTGYPDGLKGEKIPLASRIIAVADAFNAMTTDRPYRKAKTREEAIEELRHGAGSQFDPRVVEVFVRLLEEELDITGGGGGGNSSGAAGPVVIRFSIADFRF
ncbi:MAG: GAF domain-containing protein, partial [Anaerolineae bacterium]